MQSFLATGALTHCLPPAHDVVKFGVVQGLSSHHSGLGSAPKLNYSVIVTPSCAADTETEVIMACGTPECGFPLLVGHVSILCDLVFLQILAVLGATSHAKAVAGHGQETSWVVLSHK